MEAERSTTSSAWVVRTRYPRVQFGGVPWLAEHLAGMLRELLASAVEIDPSPLSCPPGSDLGLLDRVREGGLVTASPAPSARRYDRLQAAMALIEGHAEHVMDAAGAPVLPTSPSCARRSTAAAGSARGSSSSSGCSAWT